MENMNGFGGFEDFKNLGDTTVVENEAGTATVADRKKAEKKETEKQMQNVFDETVKADPDFMKKVNTMSDYLEVVNTLGFGEAGNMVVDPAKKNASSRTEMLVKTSKIVGYRVRNVGPDKITYTAGEYALNSENGLWEKTEVQKEMIPGETVDITREDLTMLTMQPEFSFLLKNGKIIRSSANISIKDSIEKMLSGYYFDFNTETGLKVNADEVKKNVGEKIVLDDQKTTKWVVKDEFVKVFGYLNNPAPASSKKSGNRQTKTKVSKQIVASNYLRTLIASKNNEKM